MTKKTAYKKNPVGGDITDLLPEKPAKGNIFTGSWTLGQKSGRKKR
jgi:hypothetical protein